MPFFSKCSRVYNSETNIIELQKQLSITYAIPIEISVAHYTPSIFPLIPIINPKINELCKNSWKIICSNKEILESGFEVTGITLFYNDFYERLKLVDENHKIEAVLTAPSTKLCTEKEVVHSMINIYKIYKETGLYHLYNMSLPIFSSQFGEDMYIVNNFINVNTSDGIFVELGAMDGYTYSNTLLFEAALGFTGVLIEPTDQYEKLVINRPRCKNINLAVNYNNEQSLFIGNGACGGLADPMSKDFIEKYHNDNKGYYVKCAPFGDILRNNHIPYIDLLSIDVEGGEQVVLETMDWDIPVFVIVIELDGYNSMKDQKCRDILLEKGFTFDIRVNINEFWINKKYERKEKLFKKQVPRLNFSNMRQYGHFPFLDMGHAHINELGDSLLTDHSVV